MAFASDLAWFDTAHAFIGLKEDVGDKHGNDLIIGWAEPMGIKDYTNSKTIPWCGLFVSHCFFENGIEIVEDPLWALNWAKWQEPLKEPCFGCLLVFKRSGGGHVGFYVSEDKYNYHVLGGNQSDMVKIAAVKKEQCVAYRWPTEYLDLRKPGRIYADINQKAAVSSDLQ